MVETASRKDLENALNLYAPHERQPAVRTFLDALAADELLFLAEFLGGCILITSSMNVDTRDAICHRAHQCRRSPGNQDMDHKFFVLTEFADQCELALR